MKTTYAFASALLLPFAGMSDSGTTPRETEALFPPSPLLSDLPTASSLAEAGPETTASGAGLAVSAGGSVHLASIRTGSADFSLSPLSWSSPVVSLREVPLVPIRDSRALEVHGVFIRAAHVGGGSVGEVLLGWLQLCNPWAPMAAGIETEGSYWYDGAVQLAPLPWGLRDERFHEPHTSEFSAGLGRWLLGLAWGGSTAKVYRVDGAPLLTSTP